MDDRYVELGEHGQYVEHQYAHASAQGVDYSGQYADEYARDEDGRDQRDAQHGDAADNEQLRN